MREFWRLIEIDKTDDSMGKVTLRGVLKGAWEFCRYVFWPQWGRKENKDVVK